MLSRRDLILGSVAAVGFRDETLDVVERLVSRLGGEVQDEEFWAGIQQAFTLDRNVANFNNGGCSPSPRVVQDAMRRQLEYSNQAPSYTMWRHLEPEVENVRRGLARLFAVDPEEVAITRNASESLETVILGIDMEPGDEILTTNLDYPRCHTTIDQRVRRDGVRKVTASVPHVPRSMDELRKPIEDAITSRTKLILISQVSFMNGQIFPVREIVELGRRRGIPVLVDGAHAFVQYKFDNRDLGSDYFATSLHKWLMAPIGTGMLMVQKPKIGSIWPLMAATEAQKDDIRKFEEIGTHPAANHNAIAEALTFHEMLGMERKEARLRYLRSRWTDRLRDLKNIRWATNLDRRHSCAITTLGIERIKDMDLAAWLMAKHGIFVTTIDSPPVRGIRVSPNVYTTLDEVDRFAEAMIVAPTKGIG
ncbi:aminotransferase class V-fold PLP-dependent enzyme [bacterium]|nr:MAG: aminotransferase class V-fold PLP-dependent enzyme [bacterium]